MTNPWEEQIIAWLQEDREELAQSGYTSIELENLLALPGPLPSEGYLELFTAAEAVERGIVLFLALIDHLERQGSPYRPTLTIPLCYGTDLLVPGPPQNRSDLADQLDRLNPPELELEDWNLCRYLRWPAPEQYECPLPFPLIAGELAQGTVSSYLVFRIQEPEPPPNDDVYVRRVQATYFPEQYREWSAQSTFEGKP